MVFSKRHLLFYWCPIAAYVGLILAWSFVPGFWITLPPVQHVDKLAHFIEYTLLGFLLARAVVASMPDRHGLARWLLAIVCVVAVGALDEATQSLAPHRTPDVMDLMADLCGALAGTALYAMMVRMRNHRRQDPVIRN